jgi:hypothetical protein
MNIQDRDEAADREFVKTSAEKILPNSTDKISSQTQDGANDRIERERTAEVTLEDKSKELKDHLMPSFQAIDTPDTTLASTSKKVEELKASSVAIAEQTIVRGKDDPERAASATQS